MASHARVLPFRLPEATYEDLKKRFGVEVEIVRAESARTTRCKARVCGCWHDVTYTTRKGGAGSVIVGVDRVRPPKLTDIEEQEIHLAVGEAVLEFRRAEAAKKQEQQQQRQADKTARRQARITARARRNRRKPEQLSLLSRLA